MAGSGSGVPTRLLKRLRASQPFNRIATGAVRGALSALGLRSEFAIAHLHRVGDVAARLPNGRRLRLHSHADDWVSNQVYWRGWRGYEPETTPLFYVLASRARLTIDVGAYVGFYTLLAAHANPAGRVVAFEPLPEAFARLTDHVRRNQLDNVACVGAAVGSQVGEAGFFHAAPAGTAAVASDGRASIPTSSSLSQAFMQGTPGLARATVAVTTLDAYLHERAPGAVDLVKIDTESTEPDVLAGARRTLAADHPSIFCEVLPHAGSGARLEAIVFPLGYRAYHLTRDGPRERQRIAGDPECLNYLFSTLAPDELAGLDAEARRLAAAATG